MVECVGYDEERGRLVRAIIAVIEEEWSRRIEEGDQGISTALGLYGDIDTETLIGSSAKSWRLAFPEWGESTFARHYFIYLFFPYTSASIISLY